MVQLTSPGPSPFMQLPFGSSPSISSRLSHEFSTNTIIFPRSLDQSVSPYSATPWAVS